MTSLLFALPGALLGAALGLVPGLHLFGAASLALGWALTGRLSLAPGSAVMLLMGLAVGHAFTGVIPAVFLSAPDDGAIFLAGPGRRFLLAGRGREAAMLSGLGSLGGIAALLALMPMAPIILPPLRELMQAHLHWILGLILVFLLSNERPRAGAEGVLWRRVWSAWRGPLAGLLTFALSGALGFILTGRGNAPSGTSFLSLLPAFVGLFIIPALLANVRTGGALPAQHAGDSLDATPGLAVRSVMAGALGGLFAALFPFVTGGVGGCLGGHATAQRDERVRLVSQGAGRTVYLVGGYLFFFMPGLHLAQDGLGALAGQVFAAHTPATYYLAAAGMALSGALAFFLLQLLSLWVSRAVTRVPQRWLAVGTLVIVLALLVALTGTRGLAVAAAAAVVGLIPALGGARRACALGVVLLPLWAEAMGWGETVARLLGPA